MPGKKEFFSLPFKVSPAVLIPRPETEFVLTALLDLVKQRGQQQRPLRIADVGTGSGCLAVCAARHLPQAQVTAIDISSQALQIAEENARRHQVAERIRFVQGNLLEPVAEERFHYVMSNPPYLTEAELAQAPVDIPGWWWPCAKENRPAKPKDERPGVLGVPQPEKVRIEQKSRIRVASRPTKSKITTMVFRVGPVPGRWEPPEKHGL